MVAESDSNNVLSCPVMINSLTLPLLYPCVCSEEGLGNPDSPGQAVVWPDTWAAGSLQTLNTIPEVSTASRALVGTVKGKHGVPGLTALPWGPEVNVCIGVILAHPTPQQMLFSTIDHQGRGTNPLQGPSLPPWDAGILVTWARSHIAALCLSPWSTAVSSRGMSCLSPAQLESPTAGQLAGAPRSPRTPLACVSGRKNKNRTQ